MRLLTAVLLATVAPGASLAVTPEDAMHQLTQAEQLWARAAPQKYSYSLRYSEFVLEYGCELQRYRVTGPRSIALAAPSCKSRPDVLGSVPALFRLIHRLLGSGETHIDISFDDKVGYPKSVYVGNDDISDVYFAFDVSEFDSKARAAPPNNRWRGP